MDKRSLKKILVANPQLTESLASLAINYNPKFAWPVDREAEELLKVLQQLEQLGALTLK